MKTVRLLPAIDPPRLRFPVRNAKAGLPRIFPSGRRPNAEEATENLPDVREQDGVSDGCHEQRPPRNIKQQPLAYPDYDHRSHPAYCRPGFGFSGKRRMRAIVVTRPFFGDHAQASIRDIPQRYRHGKEVTRNRSSAAGLTGLHHSFAGMNGLSHRSTDCAQHYRLRWWSLLNFGC
jgi:hypothetical protein